jgi:hypothetical protein
MKNNHDGKYQKNKRIDHAKSMEAITAYTDTISEKFGSLLSILEYKISEIQIKA